MRRAVLLLLAIWWAVQVWFMRPAEFKFQERLAARQIKRGPPKHWKKWLEASHPDWRPYLQSGLARPRYIPGSGWYIAPPSGGNRLEPLQPPSNWSLPFSLRLRLGLEQIVRLLENQEVLPQQAHDERDEAAVRGFAAMVSAFVAAWSILVHRHWE